MKAKPAKDLDVTRLVMGRLAAMPHKPHMAKKKAAKKKGRTTARPKVEGVK